MIESRACEGLTVEGLAAGLRISRSTLEREFEAELGKTPAQMLKVVRLTRACELLAGTDLLVKQIAAQVGFNQPSSFCNVFSNYFGQSPSAFRRAASTRPKISEAPRNSGESAANNSARHSDLASPRNAIGRCSGSGEILESRGVSYGWSYA